MNMLKFITFIFVALTATMALSENADDSNETPDMQARRTKFQGIYDRLQPLSIHGKVIDQLGQPVADADVKLSWEVATFLIGEHDFAPKKTWLKSDKNGLWNFKIEKPSRAFVAEVKKEGFELIALNNYGNAGGNLVEHKTTPDDPVVSILRKKGKATFLLKEPTLHLQVLAKESGKTIGYDFVQRRLIRHVTTDDDAPAYVCDFQVNATFNESNSTWTVVLASGSTNGGIIVSDQLLYEAPETGYQPEYIFTPEERKQMNAKYIYLTSRDPVIYTRLKIGYINANKNFFRLSGKSLTNPYGDRNLEQATGLPFKITKQLADNAKVAFRQNRRPVKPNIQELVKEMNMKASEQKQ